MARLNAEYTIPNNYEINAGTLFEDFETIGDWTISGTGATGEADAVNFKTGTSALKLTSVNNVSAYAKKTFAAVDLSSATTFSFWVYISDLTKYSQVGTGLVQLHTDDTNFFLATIDVRLTSTFGMNNGWNYMVFRKTDFSSTLSPDWSSITQIRIRCLSKSGETQALTIDSLYYGVYKRPKVIITFDDGADDVYNEGYSYMETKGMVGTAFIPGDVDHIDAAGYMTTVNVQALYDAGWDIANHGLNHKDLTTCADESEILSEINGGRNFLDGKGWTRASKYFAYPNSGYNDAVFTAIAKTDVIVARGGWNNTQLHIFSDRYRIKRRLVQNVTSLATLTGYIDEVITKGGSAIFNFHQIEAVADTDTKITIANFQAFIDYVAAKRLANQLDVVTISEWYNGLTGGTGTREVATTRSAATNRLEATGRISV